ncbi:MAG TPA: hypothetical protein VIP98_21815 [Microlunatus sp.]
MFFGSFLGAAPVARADDLTLDLAEVGQQDSVSLPLSSDGDSADIVLPVPNGTHLDRLSGILDISSDAVDGRLEISSESDRIKNVDVSSRAGGSLPVSVDLGNVPVTDSAVRLSLRMWSRYGRCRPADGAVSVLRDLKVAYGGTPTAPSSIDQFLPRVLTKATLVLPDDPAAAVGTASIRMATALAERYAPARPAIATRSASTAGAAPTGLDRRIVFTGSGDPSTELAADGRTLTIRGTGQSLIAQVAALTSDLGQIAATDAATASQVPDVPTLVPQTQTLEQLDLGSPSASGLSEATVHLGIDSAQVRTGDGWTLRLVGSASSSAQPSEGRPDQERQGTLTLAADGTRLQSWPLTSGQINLTARVPQGDISRFTDLTLTATANGVAGCGNGSGVAVQLSGTSTLAVDEGSATPTFTRLPAMLQPRFAIASALDGVSAVADSTDMAVALQRLTGASLAPQWEPDLDQAAKSELPTVLLAGDQPLPIVDKLPVTLADKGITVPDGRRLDGSLSLAVLQVAQVSGRPMVIRQSTDVESNAAFAAWLLADDHLNGLTGVAAVWTGQGSPTTFGAAGGSTADRSTDGGSASAIPHDWELAVLGALVGGLVVAGVALVAILLRRRHNRAHRPTGSDDGRD